MDNAMDLARRRRDDWVADLIECLRIPSISTRPDYKDRVTECADWIVNHLQAMGVGNVRAERTIGHPIITGEHIIDPSRPTVLVYGHYDVQPVDPLSLWESKPFEPAERDGYVYARGAADDKGQLLCHLLACQAHLKTNGHLPVNVKFLIEGEEESSTNHLDSVIEANPELLAADVAVISDNPYSEVCFDDYRAPSFLQFDGAKEVGIEFNSLSKAYNACGWRTGMMVGNKDIIAGMAKIKSHSDRGMFYPLQVAATEALNGATDFMIERNRMYQKRRDVVVNGLLEMGLDLQIPHATFYVWADIPKGFKDSKEFCFKVLDEIAVWMIPGSMYGTYGEGFFRIALTHPAERLAEAMTRLTKFLS